MNPIDEKTELVTLGGSFWYRTVSEAYRAEPRAIAHSVAQSQLMSQGQESLSMVIGGGHAARQDVTVRFSPKDVFYFGVREALQKRVEGGPTQEALSRLYRLTLAGSFLGTTQELQIGSDYYMPVQFPEVGTSAELPPEYRMLFGLKVPDEYLVRSIRLNDGRLLLQGVDFQAWYGFLVFTENPGTLFDGMKFTAATVTVRQKNLLCYSLGIDPVYGPVDRIIEYYRNTQSVPAFYLAAAQAAGMPVLPVAATVLGSSPLGDGFVYFTTAGQFFAAYGHTHIELGTVLPAGYVVGGQELFTVHPASALQAIPHKERMNLSADALLPVKGLTAPWAFGATAIMQGREPIDCPVYAGRNVNAFAEWFGDTGISARSAWVFGDRNYPELDILGGVNLQRVQYDSSSCWLPGDRQNVGYVSGCRLIRTFYEGCLWDMNELSADTQRMFCLTLKRGSSATVPGTGSIVRIGNNFDLKYSVAAAGGNPGIQLGTNTVTLPPDGYVRVYMFVSRVSGDSVSVTYKLANLTETKTVPATSSGDLVLDIPPFIAINAVSIFDYGTVETDVVSFYTNNVDASVLTCAGASLNDFKNMAKELLETILPTSGIVVRVNRQKLSGSMQDRIDSFLQEQKPAGSVLLYDLNASILTL